MKKVALLGFGLMVVSAAANAISINGSAGAGLWYGYRDIRSGDDRRLDA